MKGYSRPSMVSPPRCSLRGKCCSCAVLLCIILGAILLGGIAVSSEEQPEEEDISKDVTLQGIMPGVMRNAPIPTPAWMAAPKFASETFLEDSSSTSVHEFFTRLSEIPSDELCSTVRGHDVESLTSTTDSESDDYALTEDAGPAVIFTPIGKDGSSTENIGSSEDAS